MKDPAVLLYTSDFLTGVADLTMEERGQYITLLCLQHQKGELSKKSIRLNVGKVSDDLMAHFDMLQNGNYRNKRLHLEAEKRAAFIESRSKSGKLGGRPKKANDNHTVKHTPKLIEDVNEDINKNGSINTFNVFRKAYPGTKRGNATELKNFIRHEDWKEIIPTLKPSLDSQKENRESRESAGEWVESWPHLRTWINQRCWEQEFPTVETHEQLVARIKNESTGKLNA